MKNDRLTYVGTIRKNKRQLPTSFVTVQNREQYSSRFAFQKNLTLVSYIPKKGKNVILCSSMHHDSTIDKETGVAQKPEIITFYNSTKSGVDIVDQLCATYSVSRNTNRWPMVIFYTILNVAAINAHVIYKGNLNDDLEKRRHILQSLAVEMTKQHIRRRSEILTLEKCHLLMPVSQALLWKLEIIMYKQ